MLPRVIIHNATSIDGRIDWFPADVAKFYELASVWKEDATLAGTDTLLKAYPEEQITPEDKEAFEHQKENTQDTRPLLIIPDSRGRVRRILHLLRHEPYWRDIIILCSSQTPRTFLEYLHERKIQHLITGEDYVDYRAAFEELKAHYGINTIRVDSGGTLNGVLLRAGLVNEVSLLIHPSLVGGTSPRSMYRAPDLMAVSGVIKARLIHLEKLAGDLIWVRYEITG